MSKILPFKQIAEAVSSGFGIFKHTATGKYSARRSVSGILVIAAAADMTAKGDISTNALILSFIGVLPLIFLSFNKAK
tara:strand:+ start:1978 stop:2211 length:234 start_codon:yes stop_codon:yes gene_type:complete